MKYTNFVRTRSITIRLNFVHMLRTSVFVKKKLNLRTTI